MVFLLGKKLVDHSRNVAFATLCRHSLRFAKNHTIFCYIAAKSFATAIFLQMGTLCTISAECTLRNFVIAATLLPKRRVDLDGGEFPNFLGVVLYRTIGGKIPHAGDVVER